MLESVRHNLDPTLYSWARAQMQSTESTDADLRLTMLESIRDDIDPGLYAWKREQIAEAQMQTRDGSSSVGIDPAAPMPADDECEVPQEKNMLQQIKALGPAGAVSYALWELAFWTASIPIGEFGFYQMGELHELAASPHTRAALACWLAEDERHC